MRRLGGELDIAGSSVSGIGTCGHAISYAAWAEREADSAEIRVFNRDGTLAERRVAGRTVQARDRKSVV